MEKKPYSDRRWWEAPKAFDSACNSCTRYHGYAKCDTYPDGIPGAVIRQSALGTNNYKEDFCRDMQKKKARWAPEGVPIKLQKITFKWSLNTF